MITEYGVLKPDVPRPGQEEQDLYPQWREARREKHEQFSLKNIVWISDPDWRARFWSIQNAHDKTTIGWKAIAVLFGVSQVAGAWVYFVMR